MLILMIIIFLKYLRDNINTYIDSYVFKHLSEVNAWIKLS
ncbi:hypothetical protein CNEO2_660016 [Clostridium neonatale]|nr:hypothetical protein CNEO2_320037 [Clostridium neonatale]CAI3230681.1 hypothetical protein CNEO2_190064 [Clostridium neonatale]CAI3245340.1 hypothetical protein CNEO2_660016 [Clostridium neonatale]CAI3605077.1 hypothetical protein CNEO4_470016 [Clostridium neonatale]CAI3684198.1 hypothetical protein CNEO4_640037 [Clostridium neonatale]